jgi:hypothetical protein
MSIPLPPRYKFDRNQEKAEERWETLKRRLDHEAIRQNFLERLDDATTTPGHPLEELCQVLKDAPLVDAMERDGWLRYARQRDLNRLAYAVMACLADAQLQELQRVDDDHPF